MTLLLPINCSCIWVAEVHCRSASVHLSSPPASEGKAIGKGRDAAHLMICFRPHTCKRIFPLEPIYTVRPHAFVIQEGSATLVGVQVDLISACRCSPNNHCISQHVLRQSHKVRCLVCFLSEIRGRLCTRILPRSSETQAVKTIVIIVRDHVLPLIK